MSELNVRPLSPAFGAEVQGFLPSMARDSNALARLRTAFDDRSVLVFRDFDIDEDTQRAIVYGLISAEVPDIRSASEKTPRVVSNKMADGAAPYGRLLFHCDNMWARRFEPILSLYGVNVEPPSAPTTFVSMGDAWDRLPEICAPGSTGSRLVTVLTTSTPTVVVTRMSSTRITTPRDQWCVL